MIEDARRKSDSLQPDMKPAKHIHEERGGERASKRTVEGRSRAITTEATRARTTAKSSCAPQSSSRGFAPLQQHQQQSTTSISSSNSMGLLERVFFRKGRGKESPTTTSGNEKGSFPVVVEYAPEDNVLPRPQPSPAQASCKKVVVGKQKSTTHFSSKPSLSYKSKSIKEAGAKVPSATSVTQHTSSSSLNDVSPVSTAKQHAINLNKLSRNDLLATTLADSSSGSKDEESGKYELRQDPSIREDIDDAIAARMKYPSSSSSSSSSTSSSSASSSSAPLSFSLSISSSSSSDSSSSLSPRPSAPETPQPSSRPLSTSVVATVTPPSDLLKTPPFAQGRKSGSKQSASRRARTTADKASESSLTPPIMNTGKKQQTPEPAAPPQLKLTPARSTGLVVVDDNIIVVEDEGLPTSPNAQAPSMATLTPPPVLPRESDSAAKRRYWQRALNGADTNDDEEEEEEQDGGDDREGKPRLARLRRNSNGSSSSDASADLIQLNVLNKKKWLQQAFTPHGGGNMPGVGSEDYDDYYDEHDKMRHQEDESTPVADILRTVTPKTVPYNRMTELATSAAAAVGTPEAKLKPPQSRSEPTQTKRTATHMRQPESSHRAASTNSCQGDHPESTLNKQLFPQSPAASPRRLVPNRRCHDSPSAAPWRKDMTQTQSGKWVLLETVVKPDGGEPFYSLDDNDDDDYKGDSTDAATQQAEPVPTDKSFIENLFDATNLPSPDTNCAPNASDPNSNAPTPAAVENAHVEPTFLEILNAMEEAQKNGTNSPRLLDHPEIQAMIQSRNFNAKMCQDTQLLTLYGGDSQLSASAQRSEAYRNYVKVYKIYIKDRRCKEKAQQHSDARYLLEIAKAI